MNESEEFERKIDKFNNSVIRVLFNVLVSVVTSIIVFRLLKR